jgi:hypothetical protein
MQDTGIFIKNQVVAFILYGKSLIINGICLAFFIWRG